jgi:hypothetical protein
MRIDGNVRLVRNEQVWATGLGQCGRVYVSVGSHVSVDSHDRTAGGQPRSRAPPWSGRPRPQAAALSEAAATHTKAVTTAMRESLVIKRMTPTSRMGVSYYRLDPNGYMWHPARDVPQHFGRLRYIAERDPFRYVIFARAAGRWCPVDHIVLPNGRWAAPDLKAISELLPDGMEWVLETGPTDRHRERSGMAMLPLTTQYLYGFVGPTVRFSALLTRHDEVMERVVAFLADTLGIPDTAPSAGKDQATA